MIRPQDLLCPKPAGLYCAPGDFYIDPTRMVERALIPGGVMLFLALVWDLFFPINKALWTSSYVLYSAGLAAIAFMVLYWLVDVKGKINQKIFFPFIVLGVNPILAIILAAAGAFIARTRAFRSRAG